MDREIKFRAWDHFNQTMWKQNGLGNFFTSMERFAAEGNKITLMQFTGLYDKNGNEIYEGDILYDSDIKSYCEVVFGRYSTMIDGWGISEESPKFCCLWSDKSGYNSLDSEFEVVGNIFENPNLLQNG